MSRRLYYAAPEGDRTPKGPVDETALRVLRQAGTVTDRTWVVAEGGKEWVPYARFFAGLPPVPDRPAAEDDDGDDVAPIHDGDRPLLLRRLLTAAALLLPLAVVFYTLLLALGGGVIGAQATAAHPADHAAAFAAGKEAGATFARKYAGLLFLLSLGLGAAGGAGLAFSKLFPWCRARR